MYLLYVSKSVLVVSFDFSMWILPVHDFQRAICIIIADAERGQQHLYMGVRVEFQLNREQEVPLHQGKKSYSFTGQEYSLCKEKIHLYLLLQTLYLLYPDCDVPISFGTLLRHPVPKSDRWKGQMVRSLTSCCVVKYPLLEKWVLALQLPR